MKFEVAAAFVVIAIASFETARACSGNKIGERLQMVWSGVQNLACNYLNDVAPVRRKAKSLDFSTPSSVFSYLYPHSDVEDPAELLKGPSGPVARVGAGRSLVPLPTSPMVTEWIEDLLDFAGADCYNRMRKEEKSVRRRARSRVRFQGQTPKVTWHNVTSHFWQLETGTSELLADRKGYAAEDAEGAEDDDVTEVEEEDEEPEDIRQDDSSEEDFGNSGQEGSTTTAEPDATAETSTQLVTTTPVTQDDPHFSSYGGDIEYVFPIISFNVPFDGEIVVVGFHGYDGLANTY